MNYDAAVNYLLSLGRELAAPTQAAAAKFDLENIAVLDQRLGHPSRAYSSAHIAGTNGKGSTAAFLESILRHAGMRTGLNTSPHLERINERLRINGKEISDEDFAAVFTQIQKIIEQLLADGSLRAHPTYFECVTAMAFEHFRQQHVDFAIFEVGLGGRLDATNILLPAVTIISRIDFDHENFLGHSLHEIAGEKAGILKPGVPVIVAEAASRSPRSNSEPRQDAELPGNRNQCRLSHACDYLRFDTVGRKEKLTARPGSCQRQRFVRLVGRYRSILARPFSVAKRAECRRRRAPLMSPRISIPDSAIVSGISGTVWPGRLERLQSQPDIYLDGAHNPAAARELANFLAENFAGRKIWLIYGALRDKAVDEVAGLLFPSASEVMITEPRTSRSISASQLAEIAGHHAQKFTIIPDAEHALDEALAAAKPQDAIFVTGSLYLVGQLRGYWNKQSKVAANSKTP